MVDPQQLRNRMFLSLVVVLLVGLAVGAGICWLVVLYVQHGGHLE